MTTRIALTLAGGVSLGAYQAGATRELLWALAHRPTNHDPMLIDVITGASAGALTAAVVARVLTVDRAAADHLHQAWVDEVSFDALTAEQPPTSLLSDTLIGRVAERISQGVSSPVPHAAGAARLMLAFALSNLNGVNYRLGYPSGSSGFDTTVFSDWIVFSLLRGAAVDPAVWREITRAAIASGAFPVAFPTVKLVRRASDYAGSAIADAGGTRGFTYVDGGLFNNEPVGLARDMVAQLEAREPAAEGDQRVYILIDPFAGSNLDESDYAEEPLGYRQLLGRLLSVIMGEASKRDWIRATRVNRRLLWQEKLLETLARVVAALPAPALERVAADARQLADEIARFKISYQAAGRPAPADAMQRHFASMVKRLGPLVAGGGPDARAGYASAGGDPLRCEAFLDLASIVENVADLRKKETLTLHVVAPPPGSLAGDFLGNFGGFFKREWREHDWRRGRADARDLLLRRLGVAYTPDDPRQYVPDDDYSRVGVLNIPWEASTGLARTARGGVANVLSPVPGGLLRRLVVGIISWVVARLAVSFLVPRRPA